jgi:hypothetical protein
MPIPNPEPGLVISYAYLWHHEHQAGREEGQKDRPSVIVLAVEREADGATVVTVLPITHQRAGRSGIGGRDSVAGQTASRARRRLVLDCVAEGNEFLWPGYDLRKLPHGDRYDYGFLPPRFFNQVLDAFAHCYQTGRSRVTPRE